MRPPIAECRESPILNLNTPARTVYKKDDVIAGENLRERVAKNIGTTKLFGGFNILLYVCCSLHKYSIAMVNHCLCRVEDLVDWSHQVKTAPVAV